MNTEQTSKNIFIYLIEPNGVMMITGAIRGSSGEKMYQKCGFQSTKQR